MKKLISVLLAVIMMFSAFTVGFMAFAEDAETPEETDPPVVTDEQVNATVDLAFEYFLGMTYDEFMALDGDAQWEAIQQMDMDKVMVLVKAAKTALKVVKLAIKFIKILDKFGIIDMSSYKQMIVDYLVDVIKGVNPPAEDEGVIDLGIA